MSTLKIEHISHLDNGTPDLSIDSSGHLNIVNGNLQMGGVTMLNTSTGAPLPLSGGAMTGVISNFESTGIDDQATSNVLTILSNGSVGIGATGSARFTLSGTASANDLSSAMVFALGASTKLYLGASNATDNVITGSSLGDTVLRSNGNNILFSVDSGASSAVYIKSDGNVGIGTTDLSSYGARLNVKMSGGSNNAIIASINSTTSGTRRHIDFFDGSSTSRKGAIETNGTGTTYNTTSDRRLKDNIQPIEDAIDKLMDMKTVIHTWINNPESPQVHGFIAQEMQEVAPEAVSGDAESDEMMSMDYGLSLIHI